MTLSSGLTKDLYNLVRKHRLNEICNKHEHEVVKHIMESITNYQRTHVTPKNWWNDISKEAKVSSKEAPVQERYHEYMLRKLREEREKENE